MHVGGAQHFESGCVAVEHRVSELAYEVHLLPVALKHGVGDLPQAQHAANDLTKRAEAGNYDRGFRNDDLVIGRLIRLRPHATNQGIQRRREDHGNGDCQNQQTLYFGFQNARGIGHAEQHECKFAALGCEDRQTFGVVGAQSHDLAHHEQDHGLYHQQANGQFGYQKGFAQYQRCVGAHAHSYEKQPEQKPLERLDLRLQFVAVFRARQQHASQECAKRHGKPHAFHQQGSAHHNKQGCRGKDLRKFGSSDDSKKRP